MLPMQLSFRKLLGVRFAFPGFFCPLRSCVNLIFILYSCDFSMYLPSFRAAPHIIHAFGIEVHHVTLTFVKVLRMRKSAGTLSAPTLFHSQQITAACSLQFRSVP